MIKSQKWKFIKRLIFWGVGGELGWMVQIIIIAFVPVLAHPPLRTLPMMCCNRSQASFRSADRLSLAAFSIYRERDAATRSDSLAALVFLFEAKELFQRCGSLSLPKQKQKATARIDPAAWQFAAAAATTGVGGSGSDSVNDCRGFLISISRSASPP